MASKTKEVQRADKLVMIHGLAETETLAKAYILAGQVVAGSQRVEKPSQFLSVHLPLRLKGQLTWVSRGGQKLDLAIKRLKLDQEFAGRVVLDAGASTGGFTQCALKYGAKHVIAVDVGTAQLAWKLRIDQRVTCLEKTDIRDFKPAEYPLIDIVLADISFNSVERLLPALLDAGSARARFLLLVKPQFELKREEVPRGGVVANPELEQKAIFAVLKRLETFGITDAIYTPAELKGRSGNQEYFISFLR